MSTEKIILLLGSKGFLGSRVKKIFNNKNFFIIDPSKRELDLKKSNKIKVFLKKHKVSHIINCAGKVGGILDNSLNQLDFYRENSEINYNLISSSLDLGIKNFLNLSSSCMYPDSFLRKMNEKDLMSGKLEPTNLGYAIAKLSAANYIDLIKNKYDYNYSNLIPCNLYGPNDNFSENESHLIASIIRKVSKAKRSKDKSIEVWGDGSPKREFLYVDDLAKFIFSIIKKNYNLPSYLNVGYGKDYTVKQFYKKVMDIYNYNVKLIYNLNKPNGTKRKLLDITTAKNRFNFNPSTNIESGLKKTVKFYENTL